ncbi:acyltransferase family protein, partial [Acinetobacter baumannii]|nr:acyltransferase family protein [Acinetobacter baumannii]
MRNYKIDILRGISILLVLLHHFNIPYKLKDTWLGFDFLGEAFSTVIARNGNYGVTMFFVISGFLITHHTLKRDKQFSAINLKHFYIVRTSKNQYNTDMSYPIHFRKKILAKLEEGQ